MRVYVRARVASKIHGYTGSVCVCVCVCVCVDVSLFEVFMVLDPATVAKM